MLSSGSDGLCKLWRFDDFDGLGVRSVSSLSLCCKSVERAHIKCAAFSLGGTKILVGSTDKLLRVFETPRTNSVGFVQVYEPDLHTLSLDLGDSYENIDVDGVGHSLSPKSKAMKGLSKMDIETTTLMNLAHVFDDHDGSVTSLSCSNDGRILSG